MSLSNLIASRRAVHEAQGHGMSLPEYRERQHRTTAAQVAGTGQQEHDRTQDIAKLRDAYMRANLGKGEPTLGQIEDWHHAQLVQRRQEHQAPQSTIDAAKAERDWEAALDEDQRKERTHADNRAEMRIPIREVPSRDLGARTLRR